MLEVIFISGSAETQARRVKYFNSKVMQSVQGRCIENLLLIGDRGLVTWSSRAANSQETGRKKKGY